MELGQVGERAPMAALEVVALVFGLAVLALALAAKPVEAWLRRLRRQRRSARRQRRETLEALRAEQVRQVRAARQSSLSSPNVDML